MKGINKAIIVGTLGKDPEVKQVASGTITTCSVATSESWTDKQSGQKQEKTEWHRICFFGKLAEIAGEYLRKGSKVYIEGKIVTRNWDKDGTKIYSTEIVVDGFNGTLQMLGDKPEQSPQANNQRQQAQQNQGQGGYQNSQQAPQQNKYPNHGPGHSALDDLDVPF